MSISDWSSDVCSSDLWAIRVDLPAPLGPISAWISPGSTARSTPSVAFKAPKALCRPCSSRSASVMARLSGEQADDAAAHDEHHGTPEEAEYELPAVGLAGADSHNQAEERCHGQWADKAPEAADA